MGTNGGPSAYGTFDQGGNVWEWNELLNGSESRSPRGVRGGPWGAGSDALGASCRIDHGAAKWTNDIGFRVANVPEARTSTAPGATGDSDLVPVGHRKQLLVDD